MKNPPPGWPRISTAIYYDDPARAIDWLMKAFGFDLRLKVEGDDGRIEHSELTYHGGLIMVGDTARATAKNGAVRAAPRSLGGANTRRRVFTSTMWTVIALEPAPRGRRSLVSR